MIRIANCKINLGLDIVRRRPDGYHDIRTVMLPIDWSDVVEVVPGAGQLVCSGRLVDCPPEKNLVMKAVRALADRVGELPALDIFLHKVVPDGAGLGGGSSDAANTLLAVNDLCNLGLNVAEVAEVAATVGADCPLFVYNRSMLATGTGTTLTPVDLNLDGYILLVVKPPVSVPTKEAYSLVRPQEPEEAIEDIIRLPVEEWQGRLKNDFEPSVFARYPVVQEIKQTMVDKGAAYASMSGSGSAVYGLFTGDKMAVVERLAHLMRSNIVYWNEIKTSTI